MNKVKNKKNFGLYFIIFLTSFLLGIIFSFNVGKNINNALLKNANSSDIISIFREKDLDITKFWEVYELIKLYNYSGSGINKNELVDSSIKGLVKGLGDKHSEYLTADETKKFNDVLSGDFEGIGAVVEKNELGVIIERIIKGSPAKKYGLKSRDIIIKANNIELEGLGLYDAVDKIKGKAGTKVMLEIIRPRENKILKIEVIREKIKIPSVESKELEDGKIGYIAINMFGENTAREFRKELDLYLNKEGLIIDLRDNGGGYLQSAVSILGNFIEEDKNLVTTKYKDIFSTISYPSFNEFPIYEGKIVVLINENSASASEITAGALKDYNKAILVGKKSYGKGSVQKPFDLSDGSMLKLTIAKWFTPNDVNIDHEGIIPDIEIDFEKEDYTPKEGEEEDFEFYDRQLEVAKKVVDIFIENDALRLSIDKYNSSLEEK
ncbi:MAG: S41 family peptidase [Candidatus Gracilibacteria bacterium]